MKVDYSLNVRFSGTPSSSEWDGVTHVRYTDHPDQTQVQWGCNSDPTDVLTPGETYELEGVEIHSWHTKVFLAGFDCGRGFNSVSFEPVDAPG